MLKKTILVAATALLYGLHQDTWNWGSARPLVFGFIPFGLFYQACYTLAASLLLWVLVRLAWPDHLESAGAEHQDTGGTSG